MIRWDVALAIQLRAVLDGLTHGRDGLKAEVVIEAQKTLDEWQGLEPEPMAHPGTDPIRPDPRFDE